MTGWDGHCRETSKGTRDRIDTSTNQALWPRETGPDGWSDMRCRNDEDREPDYPVVTHVSLQSRPEGPVRVTRGKVRVHPAACVWLVFSPPRLQPSMHRFHASPRPSPQRSPGRTVPADPQRRALYGGLCPVAFGVKMRPRGREIWPGVGVLLFWDIRRPGRRIGPTAARIRELWWGCMAGWGTHAWMHARWCRCFGSSVRPFGVAREEDWIGDLSFTLALRFRINLA